MVGDVIDYDFIEIGTSDFDTLVQECPDNAFGLCVEPLKEYLDNLPNRPNVRKINCAISFDDVEGEIEVFYIPPGRLVENGLPAGLRGCNRIGGYHPHHGSWGIKHLVDTCKTRQIPVARLLEENTVRGIGHLKLDTEGGDCYILHCLLDYLTAKPTVFYPKKITFETNRLTEKRLIELTIRRLQSVGYLLMETNDHIDDGNTVLVLGPER